MSSERRPLDPDQTLPLDVSADGVSPSESLVDSSDGRSDQTLVGSSLAGDATFVQPAGEAVSAQNAEQTISMEPGGAETSPDQTLVKPAAGADATLMLTGGEEGSSTSAEQTLRMEQALAGGTLIMPGGGETDPAATQIESSQIVDGDQTMVTATNDGDGSPGGAGDRTMITGDDSGEAASSAGEAAKCIGRFQIEKLLGEGAFGAVYLAYDPHLDRKVAIKLAKTGALSGKKDVDRFLREARAAAHLRHPNIVPLYEMGTLRANNYLVYEFVQGTTLGKVLKDRHKLPAEEAARLMQKIAGALHYAHTEKIIHRDMKPDNVLMDDAGEPHIADFGLARQDDRRVGETREGSFMGTPLYMSPEQASGRSHAADCRSDVWSLGVMLQEMLTGVLPFQGNLTQILVAVQKQEAPSVRAIVADLPRDLETICQKCLMKDVSQRYQTAGELADELGRWLRGEPILARRISTWDRMVRWSRRHPFEASLMGAVCATLLVGTAVSTYFAIQASRQAALVRKEQHERSLAMLNTVKTAVPSSVPVLLEELRPVRDDIGDALRTNLAAENLSPSTRQRLRLALINLFPEDPAVKDEVSRSTAGLLTSRPEELAMVVQVLKPFAGEIAPSLKLIAANPAGQREERFRSLAALATLQPEAPHWEEQAADLAAGLLASSPTDLRSWTELARPVRDKLLGALEGELSDGDLPVQLAAARALALLFEDAPLALYAASLKAEGDAFRPLLAALKEQSAAVIPQLQLDLSENKQSPSTPEEFRAAGNRFLLALNLLPEQAPWELLDRQDDPQLRTELIQATPVSGTPWTAVFERLPRETRPVVRSALVLILASYPPTELLPGDRQRIRGTFLELLKTDPDPGVHGACRWLLTGWGDADAVAEADREVETAQPAPDRQWHVDSQGQTFAIIRGPVKFLMGAEPDDISQSDVERQHVRVIPRTFGIADHEVTAAEFQRFRPDHEINTEISPESDCPVNEVTWFDAVRYCRWLSEQAGVPESEMCYPPMDEIGPEMQLSKDFLNRTGYRLPTAAEWEYACRAGAATSRPFGNVPQFATKYVWFEPNSNHQTSRVRRLMPNDFGLFDMHGNLLEWCEDWYFDDYPEGTGEVSTIDGTESRYGVYREIRGGSFGSSLELIRTPDRDYDLPANQSFEIGFRIARTYRL